MSFTFGCPDAGAVEELHTAGCSVAVTVTSVAEAQLAERVGADLLAVQGTEAGGHQASFLDRAPNVQPLATLLEDGPVVGHRSDGGQRRDHDGLGRGRSAARRGHRRAAGHGLPLLSGGRHRPPRTVGRVLERTYPDTMLTRAFSGRYARGLANEFAVTYSDAAPEAYPEIHHLTRPLRTAATRAGDPGTPNLWAGTGWRAVTVRPGGAGRPPHRLGAARGDGP